jgi:hypothetical protein
MRSQKRSPKTSPRKSPKKSRKSSPKTSPKPVPKNKKLYEKVKSEAKKRFKKWPSAYASGWLVKEYKARGGTYTGGKRKISDGLTRWFAEVWINVCKLPKIVPCGRPKTTLADWKKQYPYCRPYKRISAGTPKTAKELSKSELEKRCRLKRRTPMKRVVKSRLIKSRKPRTRSR